MSRFYQPIAIKNRIPPVYGREEYVAQIHIVIRMNLLLPWSSSWSETQSRRNGSDLESLAESTSSNTGQRSNVSHRVADKTVVEYPCILNVSLTNAGADGVLRVKP
ncbi:unnamed protein product [Clonostachys rhizophaga]|uniref:Uncharacterized protein n=1 Tax=Clonostachys rhizophaga TaxID=160324 RepID=A0A9N9VE78_9HYPO|nr:unnamed protein product [Clonostachys rhizophaga]